MARYPDTAEQTAIRRALLANGYTPLANLDKRCMLKDWPLLQVDDALIDDWARSRRWQATGMRLDNGLVLIDVDVNDKRMIDILHAAMCEVCPGLEAALVRYGNGAKEAWLVRLRPGDKPFARIASTAHVRPGEDADHPDAVLGVHRVEIFGNNARQMGAFGVHSTDDNGEVKVRYRWMEDEGPDKVPLSELPLVSYDELKAAYLAANAVFVAQGWPRVTRIKHGEVAPSTIYDLTEGMIFHCSDGATRGFDDLTAWASEPGTHRCSASWLEGEGAVNRERCLVGLDHEGQVYIFETANHETHKPASAKPETTADKMSKLFDRLQRKGIDIPEEHPEAPDKFKAALVDLHENWAFEPSRQRPCLPIFREEERSTTVSNLRLAYADASYEKVGPKGGTKRISPVDVWLVSPERRNVAGYRFAPGRPRGIFEDGEEQYINSFNPPVHGRGEPSLLLIWEELLAHLVPQEAAREWLKDRIAHKVQHPENPGVAVLFYSPVHGTGRGTLFDILRAVFGHRYARNINASQILGGGSQSQYNDWQQGRLVGFVEEVLQNGEGAEALIWRRRKDYEKLKEHLEPRPRWVQITRKTLPNTEDLVCISMFMATNHDNALPIDEADRRIVVIRGTDTKLTETAIGRRVHAQRDAQGQFNDTFAATVYRWAMERDVNDFDVFSAPDWGGKAQMVDANRTELDDLADEVLAGWPCDWAERSAFIDRFVRAAERRKIAVNGNFRAKAGDLLRERWPLSDRPHIGTKGSRKTVFFRNHAEKTRFETLTIPERGTELHLQEQFDTTASPELLAKRLGIVALDGGKHDT